MRIAVVVVMLCVAGVARAGDASEPKLECRQLTVIDSTIVECEKDSTDRRCADDYVAPADAEKFHFVERCSVTMATLPADTVTALIHEAPPYWLPGRMIAPRFEKIEGAPGYRASIDLPPSPSVACKTVGVEAWVELEHGTWHGRTTFKPRCERSKGRVSCKTPDGKPMRAGARLDRDLTCTITGDPDAKPDRVRIEVDVARPVVAVMVPSERPRRPEPGSTVGRITVEAEDLLLPCARTSIRGVVYVHGVARRTRPLTLTPSCPRVRASASLSCADEATSPSSSSICHLEVTRAPEGPLRAWFTSDLDEYGNVTTVELEGAVTTVKMVGARPSDMPCRPAYVRAALATPDGAIAWTGKVAIRPCAR